MGDQIWLAAAIRKEGVTVHERSGWQTRGYDGFNPVAVVAHATGGALNSTDEGEMRVLWVTGSPSAPAPIAQIYLNREGVVWVGASGVCNHIGDAPLPGTGQSGNDNAIGIEAQHTPGEPWSSKQYNAYVKVVAAILKHKNWGIGRVFGHKEISQSGKTDPYGMNMDKFRADVKAYIEGDDVSADDVWNKEYIPSPRVDGLGREISPEELAKNPTWLAKNMMRNQFELQARTRGEQLAQHEAMMAAIQTVKDMPDADFEQIKAAAELGAGAALAQADIMVHWGPQGA